MTQRHVDLFKEVLESDSSPYICDRINFIDDSEIGEQCIELIEKWLEANGGFHVDDCYVKHSFDYTPFRKDGMSREEWVETILVPLALALPEEK